MLCFLHLDFVVTFMNLKDILGGNFLFFLFFRIYIKYNNIYRSMAKENIFVCIQLIRILVLVVIVVVEQYNLFRISMTPRSVILNRSI